MQKETYKSFLENCAMSSIKDNIYFFQQNYVLNSDIKDGYWSRLESPIEPQEEGLKETIIFLLANPNLAELVFEGWVVVSICM